ncbi:MAG: amidohydrolase family protein [Acidobacteria bacterium]|nr:amidohydrolase family protein [Acidobacteriota bacterium]MYD71252.1 amidohydrolase family protein [Acidobacteriota bacterium]MYJ03948.1 amidohydrolase family protein [Acidobacteriota bacterium]
MTRVHRQGRPVAVAAATLATVALLAAACGPGEPEMVEPTPGLLAFTGAKLITGEGDAIDNGTMIVRDGMIEAVGATDAVEVPADATTVDLSGRTVTPGLVNAHGHVNNVRGLEADPSFYTEEHVADQLALYARYGVTTVASLGGDGPEGVAVRNREDASLTHARIRVAGPVVVADDPEEAVAIVNEIADMGVDFIKIRVDDNLGNSQKMTPEVYKAVIDASHARGLKLTSHMYYLEDSKGLLEAGSDFLAHSIRDAPVDDEMIRLLQETGVCYCPTLMREVSTYVYEDRPDWFDDPFFLRDADPTVMAALQEPERMEGVRNSSSAQTYKAQLPLAMENLKTLHDAGIPIAMGTDTGPAARFQGYFEHGELELMVESGMTPMETILASTSVAADCLGIEGVGRLGAGNHADFVVFTADPSVDIANSKTIESVWIAGNEVPGSTSN